MSPRALTSRNKFGREHPLQVITRLLASVHFVDISYRPFATNSIPSFESYLADELCTLTIVLKSVVAPQLRSEVRATSRPSGELDSDFRLFSQLLQPASPNSAIAARSSILVVLVATSLVIVVTSNDLRLIIRIISIGWSPFPITPLGRGCTCLPLCVSRSSQKNALGYSKCGTHCTVIEVPKISEW